MARIHDKEPVLRTLFTIKTPKPGTKEWNSQLGARILEDSTIKVLLYSYELLDPLIRDYPPYVVKIHQSPENGFITFTDVRGEEVAEGDIDPNDGFEGTKLMIEISPFYSMKWVLMDLYARLKEIADTWNDHAQLEIEFDESFCWLGGQHKNMV